MAEQRFAGVKVGVFVIVCLVVVTGMILKFGKYERLAAKTYEITVVFPNVGGIVKDASVLYGGITVGKVRDITLDQEGLLKVNVKLAIFEGVRIRKDSKFVINQSGLLGDRYIDVVPQSATAEPIKPGEMVEGTTSVDLSEAIRGVVDVLHQAAGTIERVDRAVQRIDETILSRESLEHASSSLANIDAVSSNAIELTLSLRGVIDENRGKVDNTLTKFSSAAENLNQTSKDVDQVVKNFDQIVASNQDDLRTATRNLAESAQRMNDIITRLQSGQGTVGKLLVDQTLHDEIVHLVQNWRKYGLLYKEGARKPEAPKHGAVPQPARPTQSGGGTLIFGTDSTQPAK
jgi:phospholipid/cholesterol/gamma-HCH transport system substrate-binding protein